jgi:hypothetical protein
MESPQLPIRFSGGRGARVESPTKIKFPADAAIAAKTAPAAITMRVPFIINLLLIVCANNYITFYGELENFS